MHYPKIIFCWFSCAVFLTACPNPITPEECVRSTDCLQGGVAGVCLPSPSSTSSWCAYPDPGCASGNRWGGLAGDGLDGTCLDAPDGGPPDATSPDSSTTTWSDPSILANVNSTATDIQPVIAPNGLELYFASSRPGGEGLLDIWVATRAQASGPFDTPTQSAELSGTGNDQHPEISSTGLEAFWFIAGFGTMRATRANLASAWGTSENLGFQGQSPSLSGDGLTVYYILSGANNCGVGGPCIKKRSRPAVGQAFGAQSDVPLPGGLQYWSVDISDDELAILVSDPAMTGQPIAQQSSRLSTANSFTIFEAVPTLTYDVTNKDTTWNNGETEIYLASDRISGVGSFDLYVSVRQ